MTFDVFKDSAGIVAIHHGVEQLIGGKTEETATANLYAYLSKAKDAPGTYLFYADTPRTEIEQALAEIAEYAHERGWDLARTDPPEFIGGDPMPPSGS
ncbi:hypothetical protein SAMN05216483_6669 [Streptomyces sp. 2131.1]|uniref:hypothetical protein n=1 Tax=Streptomyces sp. 2131.1 TaxID=1855346 RepID=UPI000895B4EB|nr:hypothetical protein [Streptomyces sp. 2131.1]SEE82520.1 hypothetical protein SAMN05216483_6669 [Streptomyces sp. 2131.1]